jgi:hypothetical protein
LVGCSFSSPLTEKDLQALLASVKKAAAAPASPIQASGKMPAKVDPFLVGSASEKRSVPRRGGLTVRVLLWRAEGDTPIEATVVECSLKGLGILIPRSFTRGALLHVRPRDTHGKTPSVAVQVRNCRPKGNQWIVGCHFLHTPPANLLLLLG